MTARVVCLVALLAGVARAQPEAYRPVAVIDLSRDEAAKKLRADLYAALLKHWALRPPQNTFDRELEGDFLDEDGRIIDGAVRDAREAEDLIAAQEYKRARDKAHAGLDKLTRASPTAAATQRADLAFALGVAELLDHDKKSAAASFALAARFDPLRRIDPGGYFPEIVRAYEAAKAAAAPKVMLAIAGTGQAWIDGLLVGAAPGSFEVAVGLHLVQLADFDRVTRGAVVTVPGAALRIEDDKASPELQVRRARVALAHAPDITAQAGTLARLTKIVDVHDAVLIRKDEAGKLVVQTVTWKDGALAYSPPRDAAASPDELLEPLSGPKPPDEIKDPPRPPIKARPDPLPPKEGEPAWYKKRRVLLAIGGVFVVATAVTIFLVAHQQRYVTTPTHGENSQ